MFLHVPKLAFQVKAEIFILDLSIHLFSANQQFSMGTLHTTLLYFLFQVRLQIHSDSDPGIWGAPAYYNVPGSGAIIYYCGNDDNLGGPRNQPPELVGFQLVNNKFIRNTTLENNNETFPNGGSIPVVSSNQQIKGTGILWIVQRGNSGGNLRLLAYDATDLTNQKLIDRGSISYGYGSWTGRAFIEPTVINGKVYVASEDPINGGGYISVFF
jgi:hypothetical protein